MGLASYAIVAGIIGKVDGEQAFESTFGETLALQASTGLMGSQVGGLTREPSHQSVGAAGWDFWKEAEQKSNIWLH